MEKIIVIGCPGSGKSTFARSLSKLTDLPLFHLDMMYWRRDRTTVPKEEFREKLRDVIAEDAWIIDGNYGSTMEIRMAACDTVFFLDYPTEICLDGLNQRRGKPREDMPWVEYEIDEEFVCFVKDYNTHSRPAVLALLEKYADKRIVIFHDRQEAELYLETLRG
ncbi:MAG: AAA family ATPase [Clostridia bacterium]|nr:AAA family ATPase [Clostridia bacterium]